MSMLGSGKPFSPTSPDKYAAPDGELKSEVKYIKAKKGNKKDKFTADASRMACGTD